MLRRLAAGLMPAAGPKLVLPPWLAALVALTAPSFSPALAASPTSAASVPAASVPAASVPAASRAPTGPPTASRPASIDGTIVVSIHSPTLKHWGVPGLEAAFVPDADGSAAAQAIRAAATPEALCEALEQAAGHDPGIAIAAMAGDGNLEYRSSEEMRLRLILDIPHLSTATPGALWVCSRPVVAVVSHGNYPDERFQTAEGHRLWWRERRLTLRPGASAHVQLTASLDASEW